MLRTANHRLNPRVLGLALGAIVVSAGCTSRQGGATGDQQLAPGVAARGESVPAALAIHPLTHIDAPGGGSAEEPTLVLHLNLDDPAEGTDPRRPRLLHVELLDPATPDEGTDTAAPLRSWTVDLGAESARARYDALVTRTWLVRLGGVPAELGAWSQSASAQARGADGPWVRVRWEGQSQSVSARLRR